MFSKRKATRIPQFNYSRQYYYFVTICTKNFQRWFGDIRNGEMVLNEFGKIVEDVWLDLPNHYVNCELYDFVIMPNHVHGIIFVEGCGRTFSAKRHGLCEMVRGFKTFSSKRIHEHGLKGFHWQRSFYEHIIRNEEDLFRIQEYILNNPLQWELDEYYKNSGGS